MDHRTVLLEPWREEWQEEFRLEMQWIIGITLADADELGYLDIRHVGSTSVKGMIAKPIIDILMCPEDNVPIEKFVPYLEWFKYKNLGECGRPGRLFLVSDEENQTTFHLHLCHRDHQVARDQLLFKHLLESNEDIFHDYFELKCFLADVFSEDRDSYREMKSHYINSVLRAYRQKPEPGEFC